MYVLYICLNVNFFLFEQWFQNSNNRNTSNIQIPLNITIQPTFDQSPFVYGTPKVFSNSLIGPCVFYLCERDGRVKCSVCKSWYCSQSCQVNRLISVFRTFRNLYMYYAHFRSMIGQVTKFFVDLFHNLKIRMGK